MKLHGGPFIGGTQIHPQQSVYALEVTPDPSKIHGTDPAGRLARFLAANLQNTFFRVRGEKGLVLEFDNPDPRNAVAFNQPRVRTEWFFQPYETFRSVEDYLLKISGDIVRQVEKDQPQNLIIRSGGQEFRF